MFSCANFLNVVVVWGSRYDQSHCKSCYEKSQNFKGEGAGPAGARGSEPPIITLDPHMFFKTYYSLSNLLS